MTQVQSSKELLLISFTLCSKRELLFNTKLYHFFLLPKSNEFLRNVFELGPPVMLDAATLKSMKIPRFERVSFIFVFNRPKCTKDKQSPSFDSAG